MIPARRLLILAVGLLASVAAAQQQLYDGVAHIGNLHEITVVYPAAKGAVGEVYRDSAELRASYLTERYGVECQIAADNAVTDEQKRGHLLILGWNNALLGTEEAPLPYQRTPDGGFTFAGARGLAGDHLLFMHLSPYNPDRYLVFWSRIEPELDRYLSFPFVGSDWAIYRDHLQVRQGMLEHDSAWPPVRNEYAEHEADFRLPPVGRRSEHYAAHYAGSVLTDEKADAVLAAREQALAKAAGLMGIEIPEGFQVQLFVYLDVDHKHRETGVADPVHTMPHRSELYMPRSLALRPLPHEEIHLLAARVYGSCNLTAMYEGLAFAKESGLDELKAFAGLMVRNDAVPELEPLFDDEKLRKLSAKGQGFPAVGLLVQWIEETAGRSGLREAYSLRRGNALAGVARLTGTTPETVEEAFRAWVGKLAADADEILAYREALREAHQRGTVGDFAGRANALKKALGIRSDDPQIHYQLGLAYIEDDQYDDALQTLGALTTRAEELKGHYVVIFGHYQLGRTHQLAGRPDEARREYERVLALPDQHGAHELARQALVDLDLASN